VALELVAEGGRASLFALDSYEAQFPEGSRGELRIPMRLIPPGTEGALDAAARLAGVQLTEPVFSDPDRVIVVRFRKGLGQLLALGIALAIVFVAALILLVLTWALFRELGPIAAAGLGIGLLLLGAILLLGGRRGSRQRA